MAGLLVQIDLGLTLANDHELYSTLILPHVIIGISGLALVAYLGWRAFSGASGAVKLLYLVTFILVLAQVALGFGILEIGYYQVVMIHEGDAFAILVFLVVTEALASKRRWKATNSHALS